MEEFWKCNDQLNVTKTEFSLGLMWVEASALTEGTIKTSKFTFHMENVLLNISSRSTKYERSKFKEDIR